MRRIAIVIISDRCSTGETHDKTGPTLRAFFEQYPKLLKVPPGAALPLDSPRNSSVTSPPPTASSPSIVVRIVPDDVQAIQSAILKYADEQKVSLIVTSGGTGFSPRDVTPEAVAPLFHKDAVGITHAMLAHSLTCTPYAWLSRPIAGVRGGTLIICVPGSPTAAVECLTPLIESGLAHALELISGNAADAHPVELALPSRSLGATPRLGSPMAEPSEPIHHARAVPSRARESPYEMVSMEDALKVIAERCPRPVAIGRSVLTNASGPAICGHVLAEDIVALFPHPPFRASSKDGYAVRSTDGPGIYPVQGALLAGASPNSCLQPGAIIRVNTGGPVPDGADAVVQVEDTALESADGQHELQVRILKAATPGQDIRPIGCDLPKGGVAVKAGTVVNPPEVGLALSIGCNQVAVYRRPIVAVLSTGNELADPLNVSGTPPPGQIFDTNRPMLLGMLTGLGFQVVDGGIARDDCDDTYRKLQRVMSKSDVVITTGGVSMGEVDCVKDALTELHATIHFGRVNMKPGKPTTFATRENLAFFALPGNPVSCAVCFYLFVLPYLRQFEGKSPHLPTIRAITTSVITLDTERPEYQRCILRFDENQGLFTADTTGVQASHRLQSMSKANGLMVLPAAQGPTHRQLPVGSPVKVLVIGPLE